MKIIITIFIFIGLKLWELLLLIWAILKHFWKAFYQVFIPTFLTAHDPIMAMNEGYLALAVIYAILIGLGIGYFFPLKSDGEALRSGTMLILGVSCPILWIFIVGLLAIARQIWKGICFVINPISNFFVKNWQKASKISDKFIN